MNGIVSGTVQAGHVTEVEMLHYVLQNMFEKETCRKTGAKE
jgi:hypothetical protein